MLTKPPILPHRGTMTIADILAGTTHAEQVALMRQWIDAVWAAYAGQHALARQWVQEAMRRIQK